MWRWRRKACFVTLIALRKQNNVLFAARRSAVTDRAAYPQFHALRLAAILAAAITARHAAARRPQTLPGAGPATLAPELVEMRDALAKDADPLAAIRDGSFSTVGCAVYPTGAMGVHFLNPALIGPTPDPFRP